MVFPDSVCSMPEMIHTGGKQTLWDAALRMDAAPLEWPPAAHPSWRLSFARSDLFLASIDSSHIRVILKCNGEFIYTLSDLA